MIKQFTSQLTELTGADASAQKFLVAVSGGVDSIVLAHLFYQTGFAFSIAHVNFNLRGKESYADAAFVRQTAAQWNVPYFEKSFDTQRYQAENKVSLQMAARDLRYSWFNFLKAEERFNWVVTAHHANDRFETAMLNFMQGGSPFSLAGIRPKSDNVIRPLLPFNREEIVQYATENNLTWREDSSNQKNDYTRNALRNQVLAHLYTWQPNWQQGFERTIRKTEHENALRQWAVLAFKEKFVHETKGELHISIAGLLAIQNFTAILYELIKVYGFSYDHCEAIAKSNLLHVGNHFENEQARLLVDRHALIVYHKTNNHTAYPYILQPQGVYTAGHLALELNTINKTDIVFFPGRAYFDAALLSFPLQWRLWQPADKFRPFGMPGTKSVSDFLIDLKTPQTEKEQQTVLLSNNQIIWVVAKRQSEDFCITERTKTVIEIKFRVIND